ncbi:hypothetical protein PENTCL1PPCAC_16903 [Pristionchus entomophagus]|uniref:G protein-coupled receptor n=1 Tax=Pristionchus entomophagus TaxID=358040 RepID=A0AAV5TKH4_9BILA|nr:hypothetical protein PENTCL1PPCAC_16903 [Pristionchus entomophagus]
MTLIETVLDFCDGFPIVSIIFIIVCILSSLPVIFLLIALQGSAMHENCRILISLWTISLLGIVLSIAIMYGHMMTFEDGYLPRGVISPPRIYLLWAHSMLYTTTSTFEMFIVLERIFSTRKPHAYHESGRASKTLLVAGISAFAIGSYNGYVLYIQGSCWQSLKIKNTDQFSICQTNTFGIRYSKYRFNALYAKATLNARYQVCQLLPQGMDIF